MKRYGKMAMLLAAGAAALTAGSIQAQAQDAGSEPVILTGGVTFLTDYRLRGASLSDRSEEHTSELQSLMRISYAVFCLKKKKKETDLHIPKQCTKKHSVRHP